MALCRSCIQWLLFATALFISLVLAEVRIIDDTYGDSATGAVPTYSDCWNAGPDCSTCTLQPDPSMMYNGTWHDTSTGECNSANSTMGVSQNVTFSFKGTSLTVYCVALTQAVIGPWWNNLSFVLDGETSYGTFHETPGGASSYSFNYNVSVYSRTSLANTEHTFIMTAEQGTLPSTLMFDYATYNFEEDSEQGSGTSGQDTGTATSKPAQKGAPTGAIVGAVVGSVVFIGTLCLFLLLYSRRRKMTSDAEKNPTAIDPFVQSPSGLKELDTAAALQVQHVSLFARKHIPIGAATQTLTSPVSNRDSLAQEVQGLRQQLAALRAERTAGPGSGGASPSASSPSTDADVGELKREMTWLRAEMIRLQAETVVSREPPPAYDM
ncbi:hypothetical protein DAEQUDRAFT_292907 [Daedalea quercina L-15889]|uniref:Uncharacterized protein n=1 Tax=Daedalea quercina L-15889 TaxID=1314783 RepID=A0A165TZB6_9APHY|nr:hypothetical protein DAEQUDRAFT_292907 [Daedalea quercina L-15889]